MTAAAVDAVRRELRRPRPSTRPRRSTARDLRAQLPSVGLDDALAVLLAWRDDPRRYEAAALDWHARLGRQVPGMTFAEAHEALTALRELGGPSPATAARRLRDLGDRRRLQGVTTVLDAWLAKR